MAQGQNLAWNHTSVVFLCMVSKDWHVNQVIKLYVSDAGIARLKKDAERHGDSPRRKIRWVLILMAIRKRSSEQDRQ